MATQLAESYYLKALENYPWELSEALEQLQYALSYNNQHPAANCLMGQLQMEYLKNPTEAEYYFEQALVFDAHFTCAYEHLVKLYISQNRLRKAERVLYFMQKLPMVKQTFLFAGISTILEKRGALKLAKQNMQMALACAENQDELTFFQEEVNRLKVKTKTLKKLKK